MIERDGQVWQVVEKTATGVIVRLVVDGRVTEHRAYFPDREAIVQIDLIG
jgi:hypothetical protein